MKRTVLVSQGKNKKQRRRLSWVFIVLGLGIAGGVLWPMWQQGVALEKKIAKLNEEKTQLLQQQNDLQEEISRLNTPSYIEQLAREQLGLVRAGEIMIAPKK